jgi:hypothetical protein
MTRQYAKRESAYVKGKMSLPLLDKEAMVRNVFDSKNGKG